MTPQLEDNRRELVTFRSIRTKIRASGEERGMINIEREDNAVMFIRMKELAATGTLGEFCKSLGDRVAYGKEIVFDFKGVQDVQTGDAEKLMSVCLKLKERGNIIKLKDMSLTVRNQFLLSAINYAADEILL